MTIKELRNVHHIPYRILNEAVTLANGVSCIEAALLKIAIENYAAEIRKRPANIKVFGSARLGGKIAIAEFFAEMPTTARNKAFLTFANNLAKTAVCDGEEKAKDIDFDYMIAMWGEHIFLDSVTVMDFGANAAGLYNHNGRFLCVTVLSADTVSGIQSDEAIMAADFLAQNAMFYYPEYLHKYTRLKMSPSSDAALSAEQEKYLKLFKPQFDTFLSEQPLMFSETLRHKPYERFYGRLPKISTYMEQCSANIGSALKIPHFKLKIEKLGMFGDFEN